MRMIIIIVYSVRTLTVYFTTCKFFIFKGNAVHSGKLGGIKLSVQFKKNRNKLLRLTGTEGHTRYPSFMKEFNYLLSGNIPDY